MSINQDIDLTPGKWHHVSYDIKLLQDGREVCINGVSVTAHPTTIATDIKLLLRRIWRRNK
jgi:hypothetical protein